MSNLSSFDQQIKLRAYQFWEERGRPWGTPDRDWFQAEAELMKIGREDAPSAAARER